MSADLSDPVLNDEFQRLMAGFGRVLQVEQPQHVTVVLTAFVMALIEALNALVEDRQERAAALTQLLALVRKVAS